MAIAHTSKIEFTVELDENKIPEKNSITVLAPVIGIQSRVLNKRLRNTLYLTCQRKLTQNRHS